MKTINIEAFKTFLKENGKEQLQTEFDENVILFLEWKYGKKIEKVKKIKKIKKIEKVKIYYKNNYKVYKDKVLLKEFISCHVKEICKFIKEEFNMELSYIDLYQMTLKYKVKNENIRNKNLKLYSGLEIEKIKVK
jgi:hypothetical protein